MKRTPLKRSTKQLKRTPLKRQTKPIRKVAKKLKTHRLVLPQAEYEILRQKVLERDGYRCRVPGCNTPEYFVAPHHVKYRSKCGDDAEENLACLCQRCHELVHGAAIKVEGEHPDWIFVVKYDTISTHGRRDPTGET